jgi:ATP-dependent Lhr-like helicase
MRFLLHWQHVAGEARLNGVEGLAGAIEQLDGFEVQAGAWEQDVLTARVKDYDPGFIDRLCLSGRMAWGRITPASGSSRAPLRSSPVALMPREHAALWRPAGEPEAGELSSDARAVHDILSSRGASFFHELSAAAGLLRTQVERALGELAGAGLVTADSFSGLRALLAPSEKHKRRTRRRGSDVGVDTAGRWALLRGDAATDEKARVETVAWVLLRRYGVVFRALRKQEKAGEVVALSAADPLNLVGIVTPEARVAAIAANRVLFRDGLAIAALEGGEVRRLVVSEYDDATLKSLFWPRSMKAGPDLRPLSPSARKRWLERRIRVPLPG